MNKRATSSIYIIAILLLQIVWSSCGVKSSYFQKQVPIPGAEWDYKFQPDFKVDIKDVKAKYQFYVLIRHDESYPNSNIWFRMKVKAPGDSVFREGTRIEKPLADAKGEWQGRGMGGIWEHKIQILPSEAPKFTKPGIYEIRIEQIMRQNPLPSVLNVGLIIEKL